MVRHVLWWVLTIAIMAPAYGQETACTSSAVVAAQIARDLSEEIHELPYEMAIQPPLPEDSTLPPAMIEEIVGALQAAIVQSGRTGRIIERQRIEALERELATHRPAHLSRLGEDLAVDGLLLLRANPTSQGVMISVDGTELTPGAIGRTFVASKDYCLAYARHAFPIELAAHEMANDARRRLAIADSPIDLQTEVLPLGRSDDASRRVVGAFTNSLQDIMEEAGARDGDVAILEVEPSLRRHRDGTVEVMLSLRADGKAPIVVSGVLSAGEVALEDNDPRSVRVRGMARLSSDLDAETAEQAAMMQARALAIARKIPELPQPRGEPVSSIGEVLRLQAAIASGLPYRENWDVRRRGETVEAVLEAEVLPLGHPQAPWFEAKLERDNLRDGDSLFLELEAREPLFLTVIGWFTDGQAVRVLPRHDEPHVRLETGSHKLPQVGERAIQVQRLPGQPAAYEALILVASRYLLNAEAMADAAGQDLATTTERARPIGEIFDFLAQLDQRDITITVLPYTILADRT